MAFHGQKTDPAGNGIPRPASLARLFLRVLLALFLLGLLLFAPAGRLDWPAAWTFLAAFGVFILTYGLWGYIKDPDQLRERSQIAPNTKTWDKAIMAVYTALLVTILLVCGLDAGRFHWVPVAWPLRVTAWTGLGAAAAFIFWATVSNTFLARTARIQSERGQVVVSAGPYRYVRHPMYTGIILLYLCLPLALGSGWGLLPGVAIGLLFILRTALEDRMLQQELAGYSEYTRRTRYRLLPGVW
jgi:protein-S-isoprenylcysteine O-methyltransferase Ste14